MIRFPGFSLFCLSILFTLYVSDAFGQTGVSINTTGTAPNANAMLDVSSTTKGALLPRMTSGERIALVPTGVSGMTVFDITTQTYWYWNGITNVWKEIPNTTGNSLDAAYDAGGVGLGRTITADAGNVVVQGAGSLTVAANIGIGTTAPSEKLELEFSGRGGILLDGDNTQDAFIQFENGGSSNYIYADQSDNNNLKLEAGTGKNVNILTDGANERMVVQSDGRVRVNNLADVNGAVVTSNPAGVLGKTPLTGNATDVLLGTGVFGPASALEDDDWYESTTTVAPNSISDNIYKLGTVAIGANITASAPLQVQAVGSGNPANNAILVNNPNNSAGNDAIITARVAGAAAGDPFFSLDISGEAGWSLGVDNDHANRFKIAPSWSNLSTTTAMTIKTDGNVGVATDDPDQKLQVNGVIRSRGAGMIDIDAVNGAGPRVAWGTTTNVYDYMNMGSYNNMNQIETTTRDFRIGSNAATNAIYVQNATGNVGMGTSTPDANLNVGSPNGATIYLTREAGTINANEVLGSILFDGTAQTTPSTVDASAVIRAYAAQAIGNSNKGAYLTFMTKNNVGSAASATERMRIQADGNIGVGTTAPGSIFHISTAQAGNVSKLHNPTLANGSLVGHEFGKANSTNNMVEFRYNHVTDGNAANYVNLGLWGSANTLTVAGTGNVGVGTTTAGQKLHVIGTGRFSSLAGTGDRLVVANASGDLVATSPAINTAAMVDGAGSVNRVAYWSDANTLTSTGQFLYAGESLSVYDAETSVGEVRLGAAWGRPGVYSSTQLELFSGNSYTTFGNANVEYMRLTATGNLGVGTTNPLHKLQVAGNAEASAYYVNHGSGNVLEVGDDAWITDINGGNFAGIAGQQNSNHGGLRLGSNGGATLYSDGSANIGVGTLVPTHKLHVNGDIWAEGRFVVQNGTNGGTTRGIRMWTATDSNWGIYMGTSGGGLSMSGGTAVAGGGFTSHAIRFRVNNSSTNGFIFENNSESNLFSIRGDNGRATFRGGVLFDCPDCGSASTVDGSADWGDLIIQGRVVSTNSNLHLSPPNGSKVIINTAYRAAGGATGNSGLDIEDGGLRMRKTYRWINRYGSTGGYGWGSQTHDLGNWDFCAVGHVGFRNTNSSVDEDDDVQCAVYPQAHAGAGESDQWDSNFTYQYNARPRWYMYLEGYADTNATNCAASCMNFE
jgi:hypothetical protein